jgi:hypothetical protein
MEYVKGPPGTVKNSPYAAARSGKHYAVHSK